MTFYFNGSYLHLPQTGIATYCRNMLKQWQQCIPDLVAYLPQGYAWDHPYQPVPVHSHATRLLWNQTHWPRKIKKGDLVFHPVPEGGWGLYPQVVMAHDVIPLRYPHVYGQKLAYFRYWVPLSLRSARQIICNSHQTQRDLTEFYNLAPERITVIPLAYDRERFFAQAEVAPPVPYLLYVGSHEPHKNLMTLIQAFGQIQTQWQGELWIAGRADPRYTPELQRAGKGRIRWLDYIPPEALPQLYRRATAFIFPSLFEGFGLPILEAMACGTPVICAHSSSLPEVGGQAVAYFDPQSPTDLVRVITQLLSDPIWRDQLARQGIQQAQGFSWEATAQKTLAVCRRI